MSEFKYLNKDGSIKMAFSSSLAGIFIVPPGMEVNDAVPMEKSEFTKHIEKIEVEEAKKPKPRDLADVMAELDQLKSDHDKVKADLADVKANAKSPKNT